MTYLLSKRKITQRKKFLRTTTRLTCLNKAYQDFIFKLSEVTDLLCPNKELRLKANSKPWIDFEIISAVRRRDKLFKKYTKNLV